MGKNMDISNLKIFITGSSEESVNKAKRKIIGIIGGKRNRRIKNCLDESERASYTKI